jgi:hypothetical protein
MHRLETDGGVRLELYVRDELPPPATQQSAEIRDRLQRLDRESVIRELTTRKWPSRTPLAGVSPTIRDRYLAFTQWEAAGELRLRPFFAIRECFTPREGERTDWLVLPAICLAVYVDDSLEMVYPHASETGNCTVEDGVAWLERQLFDQPTLNPASAD